MFKTYNRLDRVELNRVNYRQSHVGTLLTSRKSSRDFSQKPVSISEVSEILYFSAGITNNRKELAKTRRSYPSAGAKYPLEIYPLILHGKNIENGLYHYNVLEHSLEILLKPLKNEDIENIWTSQKWFKKASVIIIITAIYERSTIKYGNKGIGFNLIEAGHLGQNIYLLAEEMGIGCCAIGGLKEKPLIKLLDINPDKEIPIYYIALGN